MAASETEDQLGAMRDQSAREVPPIVRCKSDNRNDRRSSPTTCGMPHLDPAVMPANGMFQPFRSDTTRLLIAQHQRGVNPRGAARRNDRSQRRHCEQHRGHSSKDARIGRLRFVE